MQGNTLYVHAYFSCYVYVSENQNTVYKATFSHQHLVKKLLSSSFLQHQWHIVLHYILSNTLFTTMLFLKLERLRVCRKAMPYGYLLMILQKHYTAKIIRNPFYISFLQILIRIVVLCVVKWRNFNSLYLC